MLKMRFKALVLLILLVLTLTYAHPHPVMCIEANPNEIRILALHWQVVDLPYLQENFVLEDCNYSVFMQDPFKYDYMETDISIYHNCSKLKVKKNTLFKDYWGDIPLLVQTEGFDDGISSNFVNKSKTMTQQEIEQVKEDFYAWFDEPPKSNEISFSGMSLPDNPFLLLLILFPVGAFFSLTGDFFNLVLPISLSSKSTKDDLLWLKAGVIHLTSTYIFLFLSLNLLASKFLKFNGLIIVLIGGLMLLENYLKRKNISPLFFALIPCSGALFVSTIIFKDNLLFTYLAPLIMGAGEMLVLRAGTHIPYPKKFIRYVPYLIILMGGFLIVKFLI